MTLDFETIDNVQPEWVAYEDGDEAIEPIETEVHDYSGYISYSNWFE